jgi:conjugal transfer pilus assembly protein TraV
MQKINFFVLAALSVALTACSSNPTKGDCSSVANTRLCKTPTEIYELTNNDSFDLYQATLSSDNTESDEGMFKSSSSSKSNSSKPQTQAQEAVNLFSKPQFQASSSPMPVLEQPKVLRIWVAPWKDENETLNWGSYMFTEITPRRWNFGDSVMRNTPITAPNKADYASTSVETKQNIPVNPQNAAASEISNIQQAIQNQNNPQMPLPQPLSPEMQRQNQLADMSGL